MSKTRNLLHIVFTTKHRRKTIPIESRRRLYAYLYALLKNKHCTVLRINGLGDHIHLLIDLNPTIALADIVKEMKRSSSLWMKNEEEFKSFDGWNEGYYAASIGPSEETACINYIINQEKHHGLTDFLEEMRYWAMECKLNWDERDWC